MENREHSLIQIIKSKSIANTEEARWQPKLIREQVEMIAKEFDLPKEGTLNFLDTQFLQVALPVGALGWFALPDLDALASSYGQLTQLALDKISQRFGEFENLDCKSTPEKFFLSEKTRLALETIRLRQKGAILIVPVKFGAKTSLESTDEFSLGSFFTACLGLTHPERYSQTPPVFAENATVECVGFGPVNCRTCWFDDARIKWHQATGMIPKWE